MRTAGNQRAETVNSGNPDTKRQESPRETQGSATKPIQVLQSNHAVLFIRFLYIYMTAAPLESLLNSQHQS